MQRLPTSKPQPTKCDYHASSSCTRRLWKLFRQIRVSHVVIYMRITTLLHCRTDQMIDRSTFALALKLLKFQQIQL